MDAGPAFYLDVAVPEAYLAAERILSLMPVPCEWIPVVDAQLPGGGWGAWEIGGRVSTIDLNDQLANANGVAGGRQTIYTAALNWYVNRNVRFMFDYLHGDIAKQASAVSAVNTGATFDAFAMRTQVAF